MISYEPAILLLQTYPKKMKPPRIKDIYTPMDTVAILPKSKYGISLSTHQYTNSKENVGQIQWNVIGALKQGQEDPVSCDNMDESRGHCAK